MRWGVNAGRGAEDSGKGSWEGEETDQALKYLAGGIYGYKVLGTTYNCACTSGSIEN